MFDLISKVKNKMKPSYWSRGASYFKDGSVGDINIEKKGNDLVFEAEVEGSYHEDYSTDITIDGNTKKISYDCDCYAYGVNIGCKHISALARKIGSIYEINDNLEIQNKITGEIIRDEDSMDTIPELDEIFSKFFGGYIPNNTGSKKLDKLQIFSKLEKNPFAENQDKKIEEEKKLYKFKLDFPKESYSFETFDIVLCLYKGKELKNGKISSGTQVYRNNINSFPKKFRDYGQLLEYSKSNYYYGQKESDNITFLDSPEFFMQKLFSLEDNILKKESNKEIYIDKNNYNLKILTRKKENKYNISLSLESNGETKTILNNYKIIGKQYSKNFAVLTTRNKLLFFETDLDLDFIVGLNKEPLDLNKDEFEELKKSPYFSKMLEFSSDIEVFGLKSETGKPVGKLVVEIDEDFEEVKIDKVVDYGNNNKFNGDNFDKDFFVTNDNIIIKRDRNEEKNIFEEIKSLEYFGDIVSDFRITKIVDDNIDEFFDEIERLIESGFDIEYKQETKRVSKGKLGVSVQVESGIDFFDTKTVLTLGDKELEEYSEFIDLIGKYPNKKSITLKNGMTVLVKDDLQKSFDTLEELGIDKKDIGDNVKISKHNIGLLKEKKGKNDLLDFKLDAEAKKLKKSLSNFNGIKKSKLPENIKAELRDYQQVGYNWMNFLEKYNFSGILADDMGLGKTLQTLAILQKVYLNNKVKIPSLVVCPTSLVYNWLDEASKFTPDLKVEHIINSKSGFDEIKKDTRIIIVSYGIIANLVDAGKLPKKFHYLILDESQNIKNPVAKRTKSIGKIETKYRLALSGTPLENNLAELWSEFNFLMPGFLATLGKFKSKYMGANPDKDSLKNLSAKVKPFILRRTKEEVLKELPPKQEEIIKLEMGEKQKAFYIKLKNAFKLQITKELEEQGLNKARFKVLDSLLKLRQACLTPELVAMKSVAPKESIKLKYIEENLEDMISSGHNLLIFSQFTGFLKYVREILENKKIDYNYIDGQVKSKDRKALVDEFNSGKKNVFVISLKAGGTGLNLTKADYVIHLDPWWNPAVENQATDRAHRMGQKKTVFVQKLICKDSIEEKILELQEKKKKLIDDVFSGNFAGSLSKEDIDFIFE